MVTLFFDGIVFPVCGFVILQNMATFVKIDYEETSCRTACAHRRGRCSVTCPDEQAHKDVIPNERLSQESHYVFTIGKEQLKKIL